MDQWPSADFSVELTLVLLEAMYPENVSSNFCEMDMFEPDKPEKYVWMSCWNSSAANA